MKLNRLLLFVAPLLAAALTGCDEYEGDYRQSFYQEVAVKKNILIEDFTGQRCSNCPKAAQEVENLQSTYGKDRIIAVSIHGGSLSVHEKNSSIGLANDLGAEYHEHWGLQAWPKGCIDRKSGIVDYEKWNSFVSSRIGVMPKVELDVTSVALSGDSLSLAIQVKGEETVTGKLQVWLTESNIVAGQIMPADMGGGFKSDYVHNHVLRASLSDAYGDALSVSEGESVTKTYGYKIPDVSQLANKTPWNVQNLSVVVFYYNDADGVMQVIDKKVQE